MLVRNAASTLEWLGLPGPVWASRQHSCSFAIGREQQQGPAGATLGCTIQFVSSQGWPLGMLRSASNPGMSASCGSALYHPSLVDWQLLVMACIINISLGNTRCMGMLLGFNFLVPPSSGRAGIIKCMTRCAARMRWHGGQGCVCMLYVLLARYMAGQG